MGILGFRDICVRRIALQCGTNCLLRQLRLLQCSRQRRSLARCTHRSTACCTCRLLAGKCGKSNANLVWLFESIRDGVKSKLLYAEDVNVHKLRNKARVSTVDVILYKQPLLSEAVGPPGDHLPSFRRINLSELALRFCLPHNLQGGFRLPF